MDAVGRSGSQAPFGIGRSQVTTFGMLSLALCVACLGLAAPGVAFNWRSDDQVGPAHTHSGHSIPEHRAPLQGILL